LTGYFVAVYLKAVSRKAVLVMVVVFFV